MISSRFRENSGLVVLATPLVSWWGKSGVGEKWQLTKCGFMYTFCGGLMVKNDFIVELFPAG
jgi:hypothetical protein